MSIEIDLNRDWTRLTMAEVDSLRNQGFTFLDFDAWKVKRAANLTNQKNQQVAAGVDTSFVDQELQKTDLIENYNESLVHSFFNLKKRVVQPKVRTVHLPTGFSCPTHLQTGFDNLVHKVRSGQNLFPHLSRQIFNPEFSDGMLFDWGIQHFHLGLTPDNRRPELIAGTSEVVYAAIEDHDFYVLGINHHGAWADKDLLRIMRDNYPQLLSHHKMEGIIALETTFTENEHIQLRKAGVNTIVDLDGEFYMSPGDGINSAGGSMESTMRINFIRRWYRNAQKAIISGIEKIRDGLAPEQAMILSTLDLRMTEGENDRITVKDSLRGVEVILYYTDDRRGFKEVVVNSGA